MSIKTLFLTLASQILLTLLPLSSECSASEANVMTDEELRGYLDELMCEANIDAYERSQAFKAIQGSGENSRAYTVELVAAIRHRLGLSEERAVPGDFIDGVELCKHVPEFNNRYIYVAAGGVVLSVVSGVSLGCFHGTAPILGSDNLLAGLYAACSVPAIGGIGSCMIALLGSDMHARRVDELRYEYARSVSLKSGIPVGTIVKLMWYVDSRDRDGNHMDSATQPLCTEGTEIEFPLLNRTGDEARHGIS